MTLFERTLLNHLLRGRIELKVTGFDMESFERAMHRELRQRLDTIECITFEDDGVISDTEKIKAIKLCFQEDFCF